MRIRELKNFIKARGESCDDCSDRQHFGARIACNVLSKLPTVLALPVDKARAVKNLPVAEKEL